MAELFREVKDGDIGAQSTINKSLKNKKKVKKRQRTRSTSALGGGLLGLPFLAPLANNKLVRSM